MQIKIQIKTPKGLASGVVKGKNFLLLRTLFGMKKSNKDKITTNKDTYDDTINWIVDGDLKTCLNINKRVALYDSMISGVFSHSWMKKAIKKGKLSEEDKKQLEKMLKCMTKIKVIKE